MGLNLKGVLDDLIRVKQNRWPIFYGKKQKEKWF